MKKLTFLIIGLLNISIAFSQDLEMMFQRGLAFNTDTVFYQNEEGKDCFKTILKDIGKDLLFTGKVQTQYWQSRIDDEKYLYCMRQLIGTQFDKSDLFFIDSIVWKRDDLILNKVINTGCSSSNDTPFRTEITYEYEADKLVMIDTFFTKRVLFVGTDIVLLDYFEKKEEENNKYPQPSQNEIFDYLPMNKAFEKTFMIRNLDSKTLSLKSNTKLENLKIEFEKTTLESLDSQEITLKGFLDTTLLKGTIKLFDTSNDEIFYETNLRIEGYHIHMKDFYQTKLAAKNNAPYKINRTEMFRLAILSNHHLTKIYKNDRLLVYLTTGSIIQTVRFQVLKNGIYLLEAIDLHNNEKTYFRIEITD